MGFFHRIHSVRDFQSIIQKKIARRAYQADDFTPIGNIKVSSLFKLVAALSFGAALIYFPDSPNLLFQAARDVFNDLGVTTASKAAYVDAHGNLGDALQGLLLGVGGGFLWLNPRDSAPPTKVKVPAKALLMSPERRSVSENSPQGGVLGSENGLKTYSL